MIEFAACKSECDITQRAMGPLAKCITKGWCGEVLVLPIAILFLRFERDLIQHCQGQDLWRHIILGFNIEMIIFKIPISLSRICILSLSRCYFMDAFPPLDCWREKEIPAFHGNLCNTIQTIWLRKTNQSFRNLHTHMDTGTHNLYAGDHMCKACTLSTSQWGPPNHQFGWPTHKKPF